MLLTSKKVLIGLVFIALTALGLFITSPVDKLPVTTVGQMVLVVVTVFGITIPAKMVQKAILPARGTATQAWVDILKKIWDNIDASSGFIFGIVSFVFATVLLYWRIVSFDTWFGYNAIFLAYYNVQNVARKAGYKGSFGDGTA